MRNALAKLGFEQTRSLSGFALLVRPSNERRHRIEPASRPAPARERCARKWPQRSNSGMQAGEMQDVTPPSSPAPTTNAAAPALPPRWRKLLPWLGLLLLGWLISRFDLRGLGAAFASVRTSAIVTAAALFSVNMMLKAFRWQRMLQAQDLHLPTKTAVAAFLASQFYGQVTLGRVGELYRAEALIERGVPLGLALSSSVYDRVLDLAAVLLVAATLSALVVGDMQAALAAAVCMLLLVARGAGGAARELARDARAGREAARVPGRAPRHARPARLARAAARRASVR